MPLLSMLMLIYYNLMYINYFGKLLSIIKSKPLSLIALGLGFNIWLKSAAQHQDIKVNNIIHRVLL